MADNFAARQCNRYTVVCTAPDVCWTPKKKYGKPIPYISSISLDNAVTVAKKTHFNGNKAFMYDQSITPNIDGDMAGKGKGIVSKTHYTKGKCIPTSSSPNVYIEAKLLVLENGTFDMNVGDAGANTVGCLICTDLGDSAQITDKDKIKQTKAEKDLIQQIKNNDFIYSLPDDVPWYRLDKWLGGQFQLEMGRTAVMAGMRDPNDYPNVQVVTSESIAEASDALLNSYSSDPLSAALDPVIGIQSAGEYLLPEIVAGYTTDLVGGGLQTGKDMYDALSSNDLKGAGAFLVAGVKDQFVNKLPVGKKLFKDKSKNTDKTTTENQKKGGKIVSLEEELNCGKLTTYGESKKGALADEFGKTGKFDRDHIPASSYMLEKAMLDIKSGKHGFINELNPCMEKAIVCKAAVIIVPKGIHHLGETYGVGVKTAHKKGDFSKSPNEIANRDIETYQNALKKEKPFNKKGKTLTDKQKKKLKEANAACKKKIDKNLEKMKSNDYDAFLEKQILDNEECEKSSWKGSC